MAYQGPSVVDYLQSAGKDSSFSARKELASKMGVQNYTGSAQQNTSLLNSLRQLLTRPESAPRALSTPSQIPAGSRALTSASEIPNYNITGQVGKTGAPGSYLYGTPRQLPGATPGATEAPAGSQAGAGEQSPQEPQVPLKDQIMAILKASQSVPAIDGSEAELKKRREAIIQARFGASSGALPKAFKGLSVSDEVSFRQGQRRGLQEELGGIDIQLKDIENKRIAQEKANEPKSYADRYGTGVIGEYNFYAESEKNAGRKPLDFSAYQTLDSNRKRSVTNNYLSGGLSKDQFNRLNTIADNARQDGNIKDFPGIRASYETARAAKQSANSAGDIVLMRMLAKITDPTTGVKEEEYKTFKDAAGTLPRIGVTLTSQMIGKGQLTESGRNTLLLEVTKIYKQREAAYQNSTKTYDELAKKNGGSLEDVMPIYIAPEVKGQAETKVVAGKTYEKVDGGWKLK